MICFVLCDKYFYPGYGKSNDHSIKAMKLLAMKEGYFVDPIYTSKVLACVLSRASMYPATQPKRILFLHTGGLAGLFSNQKQILEETHNQ